MADKANSVRNLAQLQVANTSYATDHNGNYVNLKDQEGSGSITGRRFIDKEYIASLTGKPAEEVEKNPATATDYRITYSSRFSWDFKTPQRIEPPTAK